MIGKFQKNKVEKISEFENNGRQNFNKKIVRFILGLQNVKNDI